MSCVITSRVVADAVSSIIIANSHLQRAAPLSLNVSGSSPITFTWYDSAGTLLYTGATFTTPAVTASVTYTVHVTNTCGSAFTTITLTPVDSAPLAVPANVSATYTGSQVRVTWTASANATTYEVFRKTNIYGTFISIGNSNGTTTFYDSGITANAAYVYAVQAINGTTHSAMSAADLALVHTFTSVAAQMTISSTAIDELRSSIELIATSLGVSGSSQWTAILPAGVPVPAHGVYMYADHLTALRTRLDSVLGSAGVAPAVYTNESLTLQPIHAIDVTEMQQTMGKQ